jgi:hypothetical protein
MPSRFSRVLRIYAVDANAGCCELNDNPCNIRWQVDANYDALAATGHAAAAPPSAPRNSRRLMCAPRLTRQHRIGSNECFDKG